MQLSNIFELPVDLRQRAMRIVNEVHAEASAYTRWKGQRLHHNREIVSVPLMGDKYRVLFRFVAANDLTFCGACTHQVYDKVITAKNTGSIRPMSPVLDDRLAALRPVTPMPTEVVPQAPAPTPAEPPQLTLVSTDQSPDVDEVKAQRKARKFRAAQIVREHVAAMAPGEEFLPIDLCGPLDVSDTLVFLVIGELRSEGIVRLIGKDGAKHKYEKTDVTVEISTADLLARIQIDVALLAARVKPQTSIEEISDDDLTMEVMRRMAARKAA